MVPDLIALEGLEVSCVVGVYRHERDQPQPLTIDLYMELDTRRAAEHERLRDTVDYAAVAAQIAFVLTAGRFRLLETAAHALSRLLLAPPAPSERRAQIQALRLRLRKPRALSGLAVPSLEVYRRADEVVLTHEQAKFGRVDIVYQSADIGLYRLNIDPGKGIPLHVHRVMREAEMVLGEGLLCQGRAIAALTAHQWPLEAAHCYENPTDRAQTVLCIDSPPFLESDEVLVEGEPAHVEPFALVPGLPR